MQKSDFIAIRITPAERADLEARAEAEHVKLSEYARRCLFAAHTPGLPAELMDVVRKHTAITSETCNEIRRALRSGPQDDARATIIKLMESIGQQNGETLMLLSGMAKRKD